MRKFLTMTAGLAAAALLAGCGGDAETTGGGAEGANGSFPVTVSHTSGETTIEKQPERIVVLDMAALDTIDALGVGDRVVGTTTKSVPSWLSDEDGIDYSQTEDVGTLKEPDMEAIAKLKPDLVILGGRSATFYDDFAKHFTVINAQVSWTEGDYLEQNNKAMTAIGEALGESDKAEELIGNVEAAVDKYRGQGEGQGRAMVLMTNAGEISMHGTKSRWAPIWDVFGFKPATPDKEGDDGHKGEKISFETVREINPDWIFVVDRDAAVGTTDAGTTAEQVLDNDLVNATAAAKNDRIVYLSPERWYIVMTGATNFIAELDEVGKALADKK